MTAEHVFYIPSIFLLGYLSALMVQARRYPTTAPDAPPSIHRHSGRRLLISFFLFVLVFVITHFFPFPMGARQVHHALGGLPLFDQSPLYIATHVYDRIVHYPEDGRLLYQRFTYTTDLVFPLTLFVFLLSLNKFLSARKQTHRSAWRLSLALSAVWLALDLIENTMVFALLDTYPQRMDWVAGNLGYVTTTKFALLLASFLLPAVLFTLPEKKGSYFA